MGSPTSVSSRARTGLRVGAASPGLPRGFVVRQQFVAGASLRSRFAATQFCSRKVGFVETLRRRRVSRWIPSSLHWRAPSLRASTAKQTWFAEPSFSWAGGSRGCRRSPAGMSMRSGKVRARATVMLSAFCRMTSDFKQLSSPHAANPHTGCARVNGSLNRTACSPSPARGVGPSPQSRLWARSQSGSASASRNSSGLLT
jgi:hypothetical protein